MQMVTRRDFVKGAAAAGLALGFPGLAKPAASDEVRLAVIGMGGIGVPDGVGGRGRQLIKSFLKVPGAKIAALCDVDKELLAHEAAQFKNELGAVATYTDLRKVLDDKSIDAVVVALPDHWHALATAWACQAGKDVYCEKPLAHNLWEGRQIVAAARKYERIVQVGTQARSAAGLKEGFEFLRSGAIGKPQFAHVVVYKRRDSIGKVAGPIAPPPTLDYNLWCGPAPMEPIRRQYLHYDWHWSWTCGTGEMGNNGVHQIDMVRWALGLGALPRRALSIGGRFGYDDDGVTPNTNVVMLDFPTTPIICEVRGLPTKSGTEKIDSYKDLAQGFMIQCEGGHLTGGHPGATFFDKQGKKIKEFKNPKSPTPEEMHLANFIEAVRSRKAAALHAPALEGHLSAGCSHMANISWRLGAAADPQALAEAAQAHPDFTDTFERFREHLRANGVDLGAQRAVLGRWVTLDPKAERFTGEFAEQANALARRECRKQFEIPEIG